MSLPLDNTELPDEFQQFYRSVLEQRLAYFLLLRMRAYRVDSQEILQLRKDLQEFNEPHPDAYTNSLYDAVCELQSVLALIDGIEEAHRLGLKATLFVKGPIKVRMRPENNHKRPHFHIEYKQAFSASYAIDTLECLAGEMPRIYEEPVLYWATENKSALLATWSEMSNGRDVRGLVVKGKEA